MVQPDTVSQTPVARHLTVQGLIVPSYPVAHTTVAVASYVVSVNVYVYPVVTGSLQRNRYCCVGSHVRSRFSI